MRCTTCRDKQHAYERLELPIGERQEIEEHLEGCLSCQRYYRQLEQLRGLLLPVAPATPRVDPWPRLAAEVAARQRRAHALPRRMLRPALALATVAAGAVLALSLLSTSPKSLNGTAGTELLVENSEAGVVWNDPWAGDVAQALDWVLADRT